MTTPIRPLVCGGRDYSDRARLFQVLDHYHASSGGFSVVIHGAARGADNLAGEWAAARGLPVDAYPADWNRYGDAAGRIRNAKMLRDSKATHVIAFPGGRGTAHMMSIARRVVPVLKVDQ